MRTIYRYTLRPQSALIQWILSLVVAGILVYYFSSVQMPGTGSVGRIIHVAVVLVALAACYITIFGYMPRRIMCDDESVVIKMTVSSRVIEKSDIVSVRSINPSLLNGSVRSFGIGGIGFSSGQYRNDSLGEYFLYMTRLEDLILIETSSGGYIVTNYDGDLGEFFNR